jgi:ribulose-phosphate 3-epimerase
LSDVLPDIDIVCMMSVHPGFGAQKFIPHTLEKIKELRRMIDDASASLRRTLKVKIEIDGGVTVENAASIMAAGADVLVAGNTVFKSPDPKATIKQLKYS